MMNTRLRLRPDSKALTVGEYLVAWLEGKQALRASTRLSYRGHLHGYLIPHLGHHRLVELAPGHIEAMYKQILADNTDRARPTGPVTLRRVHATLLSALNTAVRRGLLPRNPAATVELPRTDPARTRSWTPTEARRFLQATRDEPLSCLYRLLLVTGLRRGEAIGLRWDDLDLDQGILQVTQQVVNVAGDLVIGPPKSSAGRRTIVLDEHTTDALRLHALDRLNHAGALEGFVFGDGTSPLSPAYVSRHFDRLVHRYGLPRIRLHDLRHTSASLGLSSGETLLEVSRRLGHSSIGITADTYTHINLETARESVDRLAEMLHHR